MTSRSLAVVAATRPDRAPLATELARALGRDEADVQAAFARLRPS